MKEDKVFVDTNIIVYAYDITAGKKHDISGKILPDLWNSGWGVISTQVLQEFFVTVTQKIPNPLDIDLTKEIVADLLKWDVIINNGESILSAIEIKKKYKFSFWDSLIIEAAKRGGCRLLLSEDLVEGQIGGILIKNPFK